MQRPGSPSRTYRWIPDTFIDYAGNVSSNHEWNKSTPVILEWLDAFTRPGDVVCDLFSGSGPVSVAAKMLRRRFISFEIDVATAWDARSRLVATREMTTKQQVMDLTFDTMPAIDQEGLFGDKAAIRRGGRRKERQLS